MSSGNVVIAGGSGMIGGHLVRSLVADGYGVTVLTRDPARTARRLPAGVRTVGWTVRPDAALVSAIDGAAAVVNLSGVPKAMEDVPTSPVEQTGPFGRSRG